MILFAEQHIMAYQQGPFVSIPERTLAIIGCGISKFNSENCLLL